VKKCLISVNIWQNYKQEDGCLMHFVRLAITLQKVEESTRDNHVLARNFAEYTIRYDTTCYFNVRSKADMSRLNLPHGNDN